MRTCEIENCTKYHAALGLCQKHYMRLKRTGSTNSTIGCLDAPERFKSLVGPKDQNGCTPWLGGRKRRPNGILSAWS
jgi:hypothetical protein